MKYLKKAFDHFIFNISYINGNEDIFKIHILVGFTDLIKKNLNISKSFKTQI